MYNSAVKLVPQLRRAFRQPRQDRYCPNCHKRTELDADRVAYCRACGWHTGLKLTMPPRLVEPGSYWLNSRIDNGKLIDASLVTEHDMALPGRVMGR